eukprot:TRINITY_DN20377_c0_g1_i3.p1 TRINITY_DN20377_c0_g1~~TRINITY_DN20377_c0_g1_i3.p1  ORF type:complete len:236 (+),score=22.42 TRINITY_DN20377_c0_g1_i3:81-788(+)
MGKRCLGEISAWYSDEEYGYVVVSRERPPHPLLRRTLEHYRFEACRRHHRRGEQVFFEPCGLDAAGRKVARICSDHAGREAPRDVVAEVAASTEVVVRQQGAEEVAWLHKQRDRFLMKLPDDREKGVDCMEASVAEAVANGDVEALCRALCKISAWLTKPRSTDDGHRASDRPPRDKEAEDGEIAAGLQRRLWLPRVCWVAGILPRVYYGAVFARAEAASAIFVAEKSNCVRNFR